MAKQLTLMTLVRVDLASKLTETSHVQVTGVGRIFTAIDKWEDMHAWLNDAAERITEDAPLTHSEAEQLYNLSQVQFLNNPEEPSQVNSAYRLIPVKYWVDDDVENSAEYMQDKICDVEELLKQDNAERTKALHNPATLGEMLLEYIDSYGISIAAAAAAMRRHPDELKALMDGRLPLDVDWANRLARVFDNSAEYWLAIHMQRQVWDASQCLDQYTGIPPLEDHQH